jgi:nitrogen-specific signal transduction histidine kinase
LIDATSFHRKLRNGKKLGLAVIKRIIETHVSIVGFESEELF